MNINELFAVLNKITPEAWHKFCIASAYNYGPTTDKEEIAETLNISVSKLQKYLETWEKLGLICRLPNNEYFIEKIEHDYKIPQQNKRRYSHPMHIYEYWKSVYYKIYGKEYENFRRRLDLNLFERLLQYSDEEIEKVIQLAIEQYSSRWATDKNPHPTIKMFCTWLFDIVLEENNSNAIEV